MKKIIVLIAFVIFCTLINAQIKRSIFEFTDSLTNVLKKKNVWGERIFLGYSKTDSIPIYAYYYNRGGSESAMVIAGVHGSEFYGVDVAYGLKEALDRLKPETFKWKILVIPELFGNNVRTARTSPFKINYKRCTDDSCNPDPNRQMPKISELFNSHSDSTIEKENQYLLQVVQFYSPTRIVSIHCKNDLNKQEIGIYADPRTDSAQIALGFAPDKILVRKMAEAVRSNGGITNGNFLARRMFNAIYPQESPAVARGIKQHRSFEDNGKVSFGTWASSRIYQNNKLVKNAATMVTIELPQFYSFFSEETKHFEIDKIYKNTKAHIKALMDIFLSPY